MLTVQCNQNNLNTRRFLNHLTSAPSLSRHRLKLVNSMFQVNFNVPVSFYTCGRQETKSRSESDSVVLLKNPTRLHPEERTLQPNLKPDRDH